MKDDRGPQVSAALHILPRRNKVVLYEMVIFLRKVKDYRKFNGCTLAFLATEFAPLLFGMSLDKYLQDAMEIILQELIIPRFSKLENDNTSPGF